MKMPSGRLYGMMSPSDAYHSSPSCPVFMKSKSRGRSEVRAYNSPEAATGAGHLRGCRVCTNKKFYAIKDETAHVGITERQYDVLKIIAGLYSKEKPMTLRHISEKRKRSVVSTYFIVKKLRADGLVGHTLKMGAQRASGRSITPTARGLALLKNSALPDDTVK